MKNCDEVQKMLSLYIDDELREEERTFADEHLKACKDCREEKERLEMLLSALAGLASEDISPPKDFAKQIISRIIADEEQEKGTGTREQIKPHEKRKSFSFAMNKGITIVAAAVFLFIVVPLALFNPLNNLKSADSINNADEEYGYLSFDDSYQANLIAESFEGASPAAEEQQMYGREMVGDLAKNKQRGLLEERMIIKTGFLEIVVDDYNLTIEEIRGLAVEYDGYIINEETHASEGSRDSVFGYVSLRVPFNRFDEIFDKVFALGEVLNSNISAEDVTEEFIDNQSRLAVLRTKEERLLEILNKTGNLTDILAVENELASTRAEIESYEGRLRYLREKTEMSLLNLSIQKRVYRETEIKPDGFIGLPNRMKRAFTESINKMLNKTAYLMLSFSAAVPYIIVILILLLLLILLIRKIKNKRL